jgi:hypothetical protein
MKALDMKRGSADCGQRGEAAGAIAEVYRLVTQRRLPPPWSVEEGDNYFVVKDSTGQTVTWKQGKRHVQKHSNRY